MGGPDRKARDRRSKWAYVVMREEVNGPRDIGRRNVMVWRIKESISHVAIPSRRRREWRFMTPRRRSRMPAVRDALADRRDAS